MSQTILTEQEQREENARIEKYLEEARKNLELDERRIRLSLAARKKRRLARTKLNTDTLLTSQN